MVLIVNQRHTIIDHVGFHPVDHLEVKLLSRLVSFWEGLDVSVIGHRQGRLSPLASLLSNFRDGIGSIHLTHLCVGVQFNPLLTFRSLVLPLLVTHLVNIIGVDHQVMHPGVFLNRPTNL